MKRFILNVTFTPRQLLAWEACSAGPECALCHRRLVEAPAAACTLQYHDTVITAGLKTSLQQTASLMLTYVHSAKLHMHQEAVAARPHMALSAAPSCARGLERSLQPVICLICHRRDHRKQRTADVHQFCRGSQEWLIDPQLPEHSLSCRLQGLQVNTCLALKAQERIVCTHHHGS